MAGFLAKDLYQGWRLEHSQKQAVANADLSALRELAALLPSVLMVSGFIAVVVVTFVGVWVNRSAIKRFKQLEKE